MLLAQHTTFNTLDNWAINPHPIKMEKDRKEKVIGSWPGTCIQYTRLHILLFFFTCICTSLGSCFSLSFSINICISVGSIITHCTYMCTSVGSCLSVSFFSPLLNTSISVFDYTVTDCKCIGMSLDPRFSLFLSV